jgi:CheY-like chemotaxis protein
VQNDVEPLYDAHGEVCGCVSVCVDLTERKQVEDVLRNADRRKDEFLATLSHELRNPLAPIRNALEVLRRSGHDLLRREQAQAIMERQLKQLVRLTDDLLDVSRITRNRIELRRQRIDVRAVVQAAIETAQPLADAAGHTVTAGLPAAPLWIDGDFARLAQAFANLLDNAVKYTDRGGQIAIVAGASGNHAAIAVTDSGVGMSAQAIPHIFDMFLQLENSIDRAGGGLGIGLTLARRLIELHNGTLEARSEGLGRGSTFTVRLPLDLRASARDTRSPQPPRSVASRRVLIAEDIPDAAEMLRLMLEVMGHDVRVAADGVQAVAIAGEFAPEIVFLDIGMPRKDGYQAAREIRAALGSEVVLVALTGWGQDDDQRRAREAGFDHHLTKPAEPERIEKLIAGAKGR